MKLFVGIVVTMVAFAANSILNRMALSNGLIDPASFACIRLGSGVLVLVSLLLLRGKIRSIARTPDLRSVIGLSAYMIGFSFAYVSLEAGFGALILFGGVQITMFGGALLSEQKPKPMQWLGAIIAFSGLIYLLLPNQQFKLDIAGASLMTMAAIGWGLYSLRGKLETDPLVSTTINFCWSLPIAIVVLLLMQAPSFSSHGAVLAILSGGITSALGYALWYLILPKLNTSIAAVSQLTVPVIAMVGGIIFLNESMTITFVISSLLVLGGVGLTVIGTKRT